MRRLLKSVDKASWSVRSEVREVERAAWLTERALWFVRRASWSVCKLLRDVERPAWAVDRVVWSDKRVPKFSERA